MFTPKRFVSFLALVISIVLAHWPSDASAARRLDRELRDEFPAMAQMIGVSPSVPAVPAAQGRGALEAFADGQFADGYRIRGEQSLVVLRPELARSSLRASDGQASSEVFVASDARDVASIAYRVVSAAGIVEIVNDGRAVRFVAGRGSDTFLSAPLVVDSDGRFSNRSRWEIDRSDRGVLATLRLRVNARERDLTYPIAIAYSPGTKTFAPRRLHVESAGTGALTGTVSQAGGGAISGASVFVFDSAGDFAGSAVTNATGQYSVGGLGSDSYRALASSDSRVPQLYNNIDCPDFNCAPIDGTPINVTDGLTTAGINFALRSNVVSVATIAGIVTTGGGSPLESVTVVLYDSSGVPAESASSGANGRYAITLDHGGSFYARTFNGLYAGLTDSLYSGINCTACVATAGTAFTASLGATTSNINFALANGGRISGKLTNAFDSSPLAARQVEIFNSAGKSVTFATSDENGNYTSFNGLVTGTYYAVATADGYFTQLYSGNDCAPCSITTGTPISVTLGQTAANTNFALHSSQAIVSGNVTDAVTNAPLGGVFIGFYNAQGEKVLSAVSDFDSGKYTIYLPAAGTYYALTENGLGQKYVNQLYSGIDCSGCSPTTGTPIQVILGTPSTANFALDKAGGIITGRILDNSTGTPALLGFVQVFSSSGRPAAFGFSDLSGNYAVSDGLTTGDYFVVGRAPDYGSVLYQNIPCFDCDVTAGTPVHVTVGQTTPNIDFGLTFINPLKVTPTFSGVSRPTILVGTPSTTISGKLTGGTVPMSGNVTLDLDGTLQTVDVNADGTFTATFDTGSLVVGVYPISLAYGGDDHYNPANASTSITVVYGVSGGSLANQPSNGGAAIPFRVQVVNAAGVNLSSASLTVTAYGVQLIGTTTWLPAPATGNNPQQFQFQNAAGGSYMFTLKSTGLNSGNYVLGFTVGNDSTVHTVPFAIK